MVITCTVVKFRDMNVKEHFMLASSLTAEIKITTVRFRYGCNRHRVISLLPLAFIESAQFNTKVNTDVFLIASCD